MIAVSGNPVIFTPTRVLIKEGEVERIKTKKSGEVDTKVYYAHLFNDAFIYSSRNRVTGGFKLHVALDLKGAQFTHSQLGPTKVFTLTNGKELDEAPKLRFAKGGEAWILAIQAQIDALKTKRDKRISTLVQASQVGIPGVNASSLGPRGGLIYNFLLGEMQFADGMNAMNVTVIQPLIDATKGAVLSAVKIKSLNPGSGGKQDGPEFRDLHSDAIFDSKLSSVSKTQALVIKDALNDPDVKIFLRAAEGIALASRDFVNSLESLCNGHGWTESLSVGSYFNSVGALALYNQFKAYTDGQQAMLRILRTPPFAQFYRDAETFLSSYPGTFADKIEMPRRRVAHFISFLSNLRSCTNPSDQDFAAVETSLSALAFVDNEIENLIRVKQNFEKLLEIQAGFISNFLAVDPVLQKLASTDRTFIREGDLKKVCRKKNKLFHFWLFNDYLIYGTALGGKNYSFNRALDLTTCSVKVHESVEVKNAFEVFGAEKSFVVIAQSTPDQISWVEDIKKAKAAVMGTTVDALDSVPVESAPLWVPDTHCTGCTVCNKVRIPFRLRQTQECRLTYTYILVYFIPGIHILDQTAPLSQMRQCSLLRPSHEENGVAPHSQDEPAEGLRELLQRQDTCWHPCGSHHAELRRRGRSCLPDQQCEAGPSSQLCGLRLGTAGACPQGCGGTSQARPPELRQQTTQAVEVSSIGGNAVQPSESVGAGTAVRSARCAEQACARSAAATANHRTATAAFDSATTSTHLSGTSCVGVCGWNSEPSESGEKRQLK